jgi:hypothetical protein
MTTDKQSTTENTSNSNGVVTVNDGNNPTPEERDRRIPAEPDTERLRSERQSVQDAKQQEEHS